MAREMDWLAYHFEGWNRRRRNEARAILLRAFDGLRSWPYEHAPSAASKGVPPDFNTSKSTEPADVSTVVDPYLAEMITILAVSWETADPHGRGHLEGRFDLAFAKERERLRPIDRIVAWLGWRMTEGRHRTGD